MQRHFRRVQLDTDGCTHLPLALTAIAAFVFGLTAPGASSNAAAAGTPKTSANWLGLRRRRLRWCLGLRVADRRD